MQTTTTNASTRLAGLLRSISAVVKGKEDVIQLALTTLLARGHLLIEDVPGVGKTTLAQALARSFDCSFQRIQFTSDMLPSDVIGVSVFNPATQGFEFKPGPIFANIIVADEINRTTPKTQSALLEAMNEAQITVDNTTHPLPKPFLVLATQNPIEHHGTYPLPESQLDRFLMRIRIGYPERDAEREIVRGPEGIRSENFGPVLSSSELLRLQEQAAQVTVDDSLVDYMLAIVEKTRSHETLALGVSPRGSQALYRAAQALALVEGREYVIPDDIKRLVIPVFAHRIAINARTSLSQRSTELSERTLQEIMTLVEVPL